MSLDQLHAGCERLCRDNQIENNTQLYAHIVHRTQGAAPAADDAKLRSHAGHALSHAFSLLNIPPPPADALLQRQLQTIMRELVNVKGARNKHDKSGKHATAQLLCACADGAAAAAKAGRPRDLQGIAAMVNAGVYARWPGGGGLQAFAADVRSVCDLYRAALKRSHSEFATTMLEAGGGPLADAVSNRLDKLLAGGCNQLDVGGFTGLTPQRQSRAPSSWTVPRRPRRQSLRHTCASQSRGAVCAGPTMTTSACCCATAAMQRTTSTASNHRCGLFLMAAGFAQVGCEG